MDKEREREKEKKIYFFLREGETDSRMEIKSKTSVGP
jgi:hypothetical protein